MQLLFFPYPLLAGLLILALVILLRWHSKRSWFDLISSAIFGLYLLAVFSLTLFPIPLPVMGEWRRPISEILARVNLIPFNFGGLFDLHPNIAIRELGGNILLTVPFGFLIPFLMQVKARQISWLALAAGISTELAQLLACLIVGSSYRGVDINDTLLNTLGVWIGYGIYRILSKLLLKLGRKQLFHQQRT